MPSDIPSSIKAYKSLRVSGFNRKKNTGIVLAEQDLFTVIATGIIDRGWRNSSFSKISPYDGGFIMHIGDQLYGHIHYGAGIGPTLRAQQAGKLYLGISDSYYNNNRGRFDVTIIVWRTEDYQQIANFLIELVDFNPDNIALAVAHKHAIGMQRIQKIELAQNQASKEIAATENILQELKQKTAAPISEKEKAAAQQQVATLEDRLAALSETMAELEHMRVALQQERLRTTQLTQQLAEQQERETDLMTQIAQGASTPPVLLITSPDNKLSTEASFVRLIGVAEDDRGIKKLSIQLNDKNIEGDGARGIRLDEEVAPLRIEINRKVYLSRGRNKIRIRVQDIDDLFVEKTIMAERIELRRNVWAVVIGINNYPNLRKLQYAVNDAKAFYDWLIHASRIPAENVKLLINGQATLKNLRSELGTRLKNNAAPDDLVIIYFAGHGATERDSLSPDGDGLEKYILPFGTDLDDLYATAMPMREVAFIINRIRSERLVFIADACYSGASGGRTVSASGIRASVSDTFLERLAGGKGKIIITASGANEVSMERDELKHGVFTYYLLEGLRGAADTDADGVITVDEVYRYVSTKVPKATGQEQNPIKKGSVKGQLLLGIVP